MVNRQMKQKVWSVAKEFLRAYGNKRGYISVKKWKIKKAILAVGIRPNTAGYYVKHFVNEKIFQETNEKDVLLHKKIFDYLVEKKIDVSYQMAVNFAQSYK